MTKPLRIELDSTTRSQSLTSSNPDDVWRANEYLLLKQPPIQWLEGNIHIKQYFVSSDPVHEPLINCLTYHLPLQLSMATIIHVFSASTPTFPKRNTIVPTTQYPVEMCPKYSFSKPHRKPSTPETFPKSAQKKVASKSPHQTIRPIRECGLQGFLTIQQKMQVRKRTKQGQQIDRPNRQPFQ